MNQKKKDAFGRILQKESEEKEKRQNQDEKGVIRWQKRMLNEVVNSEERKYRETSRENNILEGNKQHQVKLGASISVLEELMRVKLR